MLHLKSLLLSLAAFIRMGSGCSVYNDDPAVPRPPSEYPALEANAFSLVFVSTCTCLWDVLGSTHNHVVPNGVVESVGGAAAGHQDAEFITQSFSALSHVSISLEYPGPY
jgi:hypothetical protein